MNAMNMPGFTAETSLYQTNNHYRFATGRSFLSNGNSTVIPQDCGPLHTGFCAGGLALGATLCTGICLEPRAGIALCYVCWATALPGAALAFCKDCIPGWIRAIIDAFESGGGGGPSCCPPGTICSCGGHCVGSLCTGICLPPGAACPPHPNPPPFDCEVGEKCCERDEQGNCTDCIPHNQRCPRPRPSSI